MPQTLEEFVRGTPFALELERLRKVEASAREVLEQIDQVAATGRWSPLVISGAVYRLRTAVR